MQTLPLRHYFLVPKGTECPSTVLCAYFVLAVCISAAFRHILNSCFTSIVQVLPFWIAVSMVFPEDHFFSLFQRDSFDC